MSGATLKMHPIDLAPAKVPAMEEGRFSPPDERSPYGMPLRAGIQGLLLLVFLAACSAGDGYDANDSAAQVTELADSFMGDMHVGAWHAAFSRLYPGLQAQCGSAEGLASVVQASGERPAAWTLREPSLRKRSGIITGQVETAEGRSGIVELSVEKSGDDWVIVAWSASNRELCNSG